MLPLLIEKNDNQIKKEPLNQLIVLGNGLSADGLSTVNIPVKSWPEELQRAILMIFQSC